MPSDGSADVMYRVTDADGDTLPSGTYSDEDAALDRRAREMAEHPDGDDVTVEKYERVWSDTGQYQFTLNDETKTSGGPMITGADLFEMAGASPESHELVERDEDDHYVTHYDEEHEIDLRESTRFVVLKAGAGRT